MPTDVERDAAKETFDRANGLNEKLRNFSLVLGARRPPAPLPSTDELLKQGVETLQQHADAMRDRASQLIEDAMTLQVDAAAFDLLAQTVVNRVIADEEPPAV